MPLIMPGLEFTTWENGGYVQTGTRVQKTGKEQGLVRQVHSGGTIHESTFVNGAEQGLEIIYTDYIGVKLYGMNDEGNVTILAEKQFDPDTFALKASEGDLELLANVSIEDFKLNNTRK